jgi:hypothetical protein
VTPNPVRSLPSTAVTDNFSACPTNGERTHEMISRKLGDDTSVGYVEQCINCGWIDEKSLQWWVEDAIKQNSSGLAQRIAIATETEPFRFVQQRGQVLTLREILFQAMGAASVSWSKKALMSAGEFDSTRAQRIAEALQAEVDRALAIAGREASAAWSDLAYEFYALACNSTSLERGKAHDWLAAFDRLKARFQELLPEEERVNAGDPAEVPKSEV